MPTSRPATWSNTRALPVIIPVDSLDALRGATLDLPTAGRRTGSSSATPIAPIPCPALTSS